MAGTNFSLNDDIEKLIKLRKLIADYKASLEGMDKRVDPKSFNDLEKGLRNAQSEFDALSKRIVSSGTQIEKNFKRKIEESSAAVNRLSGKIIDQNAVVQDAQNEVNRLSKEYEKLSKKDPGKKDALINLETAENNLTEKKNTLFDLQQQQDRTKLSTKELNEEYDRYSESVKNAAGSTSLLSELGTKLKAHIIASAISFITEKFSQLISTVKEFVNESIKISTRGESITAAFNGLNRPELLDGLRTATQGTMSDLELMQAAVKAESFRIPLNDLGSLLQYAQIRAQQTGESVDSLVDSILDGIGNQSADSLDALQIKQSEYDESVKKTGSHTESVIDLINKKLEEQGELTLTAADKEAIASAKRENAQMKVGNALLGVKVIWEEVSARFFEVIGNLAEKYLPALVSRMEVVINKFIDWYNNSLVVRSAVASLYLMFATAFANIKRDVKIVIDTMGAFADVMGNLGSPAKAIAAYKNYMASVGQSVIKYAAETAAAIEEAKGIANQKIEPIKLEYIIGTSKIIPEIEKPCENEGKIPPKDDDKEKEIAELQKKIDQLTKKKESESDRKKEDLINQETQAKINATKNGAQKILEQREYDNKLEIQALERQKEEYKKAYIEAERELFDTKEELEAKKDKNYSKKTFDPSTIFVDTSLFDKIIEETKTKQDNKQKEAQEKSWNEYLIQFGNYQEKRKAIIEKYDREIDNAATEGDKAIFEKKKQNELDELDKTVKNSTTLMGQLFADASKKSISEIEKIICKAELLMKYLSATKDIDGNAVIDGKTVSKNDIVELGISENTLTNLDSSSEAVKSLQDAIKKLKGELGNKSPFKTFEIQIKDAITEIKKGDFGSIARGIESIGKATEKFSSSFSQFGKDIGNIIGKEEIGNKISGISNALGGVGQSAAGVGQIMAGDIVGGTMSAASGISKVVSSLDGLFGADYTKYNEMKSQYQVLNSVWDELINKKKEYIKTSYGAEISRVGEEAKELQEKANDSYRILGRERLNSGASTGSHSIGVRTRKKMSKDGWNEAKNALGADFYNYGIGDGRMTGLFDLSAEQLEKLKSEAPTFWSKLDGDVRGYLDNIIQGSEKIEAIEKQIKEQLTQVSFNSVFDGFVDTLMNMDSSAEDFSNNFSNYLQKAIMTTMVGEKFRGRLQEWYDKFAKANDREGGMDKDEYKRLKEEWDGMSQEALQEREDLKKIFGWESSSSSTPEASKGVYQGMSQDTGDRLEARNTAIHMTTVGMDQTLLTISGGVQNINAQMIRVGELTEQSMLHMEEIRTLQLSSFYELKDINNNTKQLHQMNERLGEMNDKLNRL